MEDEHAEDGGDRQASQSEPPWRSTPAYRKRASDFGMKHREEEGEYKDRALQRSWSRSDRRHTKSRSSLQGSRNREDWKQRSRSGRQRSRSRSRRQQRRSRSGRQRSRSRRPFPQPPPPPSAPPWRGHAGSAGRSSERDDFVEDSLQVERSMSGRIIGRKGAIVMQIEKDSGAKVDVNKGTSSDTINIGGSQRAVARARDLIVDLIMAINEERELAPKGETSEDIIEESIEVPKSSLGRIIGKGGETIKKMEEDCGARIDVNQSDQPPTVRIRGPCDCVVRAIDMISDIVYADSNKSHNTIEKTIELPKSAAGKIIGAHGARVNEMREQTGVAIQVDQSKSCCKVRLSGTLEQVTEAEEIIKSVLDEDLGEAVEETIEVPRPQLGRIIGKGGETIKTLQDDSGAKIDVNKTDATVRVRGSSSSVELAMDMISDLLHEGGHRVGIETMELPLSVAGTILGTRGARVKAMREQTGAQIKVKKKGTCCKVQLSGTIEQVNRAQKLIRSMDELEETMDVPPKQVGRIMGHKGEMVMKLQTESGARIDISKDGTPPAIRIRGSLTSVARAQELILELISKQLPSASKDHDDGLEETMDIPNTLIGRVIGRGGETITRLQKESGAKIDIGKVGTPTSVRIRGLPAAVVLAQDMIWDLIGEHWPSNDEMEETMDIPTTQLGKIMGHKGDMIMKLQSQSRAKIDVSKDGKPPAIRIRGTPKSIACARELILNILSEKKPSSDEALDDAVEKTMDVPPAHLRRVMGKGGEMIMKLQDDSGAKIDVSKDGTPPAIRIRGSCISVTRAQELILALLTEQKPQSLGVSSKACPKRPQTMELGSNEVVVAPPKPSRAPNLHPDNSSEDDDVCG